jgi:hypothetical protein
MITNVVLNIIFHPLVFFSLLYGIAFVIKTFKKGLSK